MSLESERNLKILKKLIEETESIINQKRFSTDFKIWKSKVERFLKQAFPQDDTYLKQFQDVSYAHSGYIISAGESTFEKNKRERERNIVYGNGIIYAKKLLQSFADDLASSTSSEKTTSEKLGKTVFIVHGHDEDVLFKIKSTINNLKLNPVILHEQENEGFTLIEKLETHSEKADYAIILLTPDDEGYPRGNESKKRFRARQNVILELGLFLGLIGRKRVAVIYKGEVEIPSDYEGVLYIPMKDEWKLKLAKEMKIAGIELSLDDLV